MKSFKPPTRRKASPSRLHLISMRLDLSSCSMLCRGPSAPSHLAFTATTLPGCHGDSAQRTLFFIGPCLGRLLTGGSLALLYEALTGDVQKLFAKSELFTCSAAKLLRFCGAKGDGQSMEPGRWQRDWAGGEANRCSTRVARCKVVQIAPVSCPGRDSVFADVETWRRRLGARLRSSVRRLRLGKLKIKG